MIKILVWIGCVAFASEGFARTVEIFEAFAFVAYDERGESVLEGC